MTIKDGTTRKITNTRRIEDHIANTESNEQLVDEIWNRLTDIEAAVSIYLMNDYSDNEIEAHFEFSRQRLHQIKSSIKSKLERQIEIRSMGGKHG